MKNVPPENRQFSLRLIFLVTTGAALVCAGSSFAYRSITDGARRDEERRAEARRQHDRALADWERHEEPGSWDFGP